ncbi:disease resistance protein RUN1 isoform X2 [Cryptomeria japonica]|uniref:disease resistance protein RUN1 isoform X2 n=1 Tax=Cryptomeria japonica TaxID=3369 RepID=UPI0027DAAE17|nr:disease resistance protein RUN1 isoform X2 [Cryptomeria japonica]
MEEVFPPYHVFINHRGPDVKKTLASLIYHRLEGHGLRVFLDKQELQVGDSLTPAIKSAICSASVQIAIFSKTYAQSAWCLNELLWIFDSNSSKIIPIFYDIQPSDLRHVDKGAYARAFQEHRGKGRVTIQQLDSWMSALNKVSGVSGVVISTEEDDLGERLEEIVEIILKEVRREELDVGKYPVGLRQAAEHFEREVLNESEISGIKVVGIVGLGGSGKSTLVTHLYNSKRSQFHRCCFLSQVSKRDLPSLQQTLLGDLLCDHKSDFRDTLTGRSVLRDRLRRLRRVLIVFDDIENTEQIENLLFVKDVVGDGSLILVTSRDPTLLVSCNIEIYNVKLLDPEDAQELFCWHAFGHSEPVDDLQDMIEELVGMCSGFPLALKVLAGQLHNERDPRKWKRQLESLRERLPNLVERVLDGLNGSGSQCLQRLRLKCLVEFESADIILLRGKFESWRIGIWRRAKGSLIIRMHDLLRDLAIQIGRKESPLRLSGRNDTMIPPRLSDLIGNEFDVRGIRRDDAVWYPKLENPFSPSPLIREPQAPRPNKRSFFSDEDQLPLFLQSQNIGGLKLLAFQNSTLLQRFNSVSGDLIWFRWRDKYALIRSIPSTLLLKNLRVLEVHGVDAQDLCKMFDDHEPPSQLRELTVTCTRDNQMYSPWIAGRPTPAFKRILKTSYSLPSTVGFPKQGLPSETSDSLQAPNLFGSSETSDLLQPLIKFGRWFQAWLGKLNFKNMVKLVLQYIQGLKTLPIKFEEVRNLRHLDLSGCSDLEALPDSFTQELLQLQYLALTDCRKLILRSLGKISTLEYLDYEGCSMLIELPRGTEAQRSLKYLNALRTGLRKLTQDLQQLGNLEELHIGSSDLTELPSSLYTLSSLTDLTLFGCTNLLFIDNSIEKLVHLERFRIYNCEIGALPERIAWTNVKSFDVQRCPLYFNNLVIGVDSGSTPAGSSRATRSIDHNRSSCLTNLIIRNSHILGIDIPEAESLFPKLEIVDLSGNDYLREIGRLPGSLITLNLINCFSLRTLACFSTLAGLKVLDISGCVELETLNVEGLSSIEVIKADRCWKIQSIEGLEQLQKLSYFQISVHSLPRPSCTDIMTCARNISTAVLSGTTSKMEDVDEMDRIARRFEGVEVRRILQRDPLQIHEKPKGAIFLYLITDPLTSIEVTFFGHVYTTQSSASNYPVHILMWTEDSEAYKDFKSSSVKAQDFSLLKAQMKKGWMVQAENSEVCKQFIRHLFFEGYI